MPAKIKATAMPSERRPDGIIVTPLFDPRAITEECTIASVDALEPLACKIAERLGIPCVVWITVAAGQRKPPRFDATTRQIQTRFREPGNAWGAS